MTNQIAKILNIEPIQQTLNIEGREFQYHPEGQNTVETIFTYWNGASRSFTIQSCGHENIETQLKMFMGHIFNSKKRAEFLKGEK